MVRASISCDKSEVAAGSEEIDTGESTIILLQVCS
ncbi:hypothetical protein BIW11_13508 [Tropilaelaps mercedesae]|uniref:Uncharacterized protein n=1 Tax=Tropilaelaps mercedesae TaxID=418985 RepID=A0A1V9X255_9ACAR|nr:hypothetical protein BIW11_13508 [Tropilaelaps mercedesae]